MSSVALTRQYIRDADGKQIGVILPLEEYQALMRLQPRSPRRARQSASGAAPAQSLYGALRHLSGTVAPTEDLDETRRTLWAAWDESDTP